MTLPLVSRIATAELVQTGRSVGTVFSVNTLGTVLGAAVTGFWLMPWLGLARTLALGIALNAVIGVVILSRRKRELRPALAVLAPAGALALVFGAGIIFDEPWQRAFNMGLWRESPPASLAEYRQRAAGFKLKYYRDGASSTVCVNFAKTGDAEFLYLRVNGKPDAGTQADVPTQLLCGHIPMLLRPASKQVLVIGLGSGMTCGAVLRHPGVERLDVVEISPEVAEAARQFAAYNDKVLDQPRLRLVLEDAKSYLQITDRIYDVIISEPSNPWMAGVSGVFSREYYESCRSRLQTNGVMAQWVQIYETNDRALEIVLSTFSSVFPFASVWQTSPADLLLIGSTQPVEVDLAALHLRFHESSVRTDLERCDVFSLPVLLGREIISAQNTAFIPEPDTGVHSDFYPVLEYVAQRAFFVRDGASLHRTFDENLSTRPGTLLGRYLQSYPLAEVDLKALALFRGTHQLPDTRLFRSLLKRWQTDFPQSITAAELSAKSLYFGAAEELEVQRLAAFREGLFANATKDPELLRSYSQLLTQTYRSYRSVFYRPPTTELEAVLERLIETDPANQRVHRLRLAELMWDRRDDVASFKYGQSAFDPDVAKFGPTRFDLDPRAPARALARMIETLWRAGKPQDAWNLCRQAREQGYAGPKAAHKDSLLEMTCRKVEYALDLSAASPLK